MDVGNCIRHFGINAKWGNNELFVCFPLNNQYFIYLLKINFLQYMLNMCPLINLILRILVFKFLNIIHFGTYVLFFCTSRIFRNKMRFWTKPN